jgi:4-amino-4-deoxy-L-arabinose transferase-like glycosyltransferase
LVSALASAGAVYQIHVALKEWGVQRTPRILLTLGFGLNPMIIYYAGNGMSDALYVFCLVATTRYLMRWIRQGDLRSLVYAAIALGVAYLDRNEAVGSAVLAGAVVFAITFSRTRGTQKSRFMLALTDGVIFLTPVVTTFAAWATASDVITGQPFAQFTSQYGNTAQIAAGNGHYTLMTRIAHDARSIEYLAPLIPVVLIVALVMAYRQRDARVFGPIAILGGSLAFDALGVITNSLEPWYRYFLTSVPLEVLLVGCIVATTRDTTHPNKIGSPGSVGRRVPWKTLAGALFVILMIAPSLPTSVIGIFAKNIQSSESQELGALLLAHPSLQDKQFKRHFSHIESIDAYLAAMHLPNGSIVVDTFGSCTPQIVTTVADPKIFVITNDRDFKEVLADPLTFHAHYLLDPPPTGTDANDALNVAYPDLYGTGAGFATRIHEFPSDGVCSPLRLFRVIRHPGV